MLTDWLSGAAAWRAIALISAIWAAIGLASGFGAQFLGSDFLLRDNWLTRPRRFEDNGRVYERRLRISRWKDRLPEAGTAFGGASSKRTLMGTSSEDLELFGAETRRAEYVHWTNIAAAPAFLVVLPPLAALAMTGFACSAHLPFILVQRYNRFRIGRIVEGRARRGAARCG